MHAGLESISLIANDNMPIYDISSDKYSKSNSSVQPHFKNCVNLHWNDRELHNDIQGSRNDVEINMRLNNEQGPAQSNGGNLSNHMTDQFKFSNYPSVETITVT